MLNSWIYLVSGEENPLAELRRLARAPIVLYKDQRRAGHRHVRGDTVTKIVVAQEKVRNYGDTTLTDALKRQPVTPLLSQGGLRRPVPQLICVSADYFRDHRQKVDLGSYLARLLEQGSCLP